MNLTYRSMNLDDPDEMRFIAETDVTIPAMYDPSFETDEKAILDRIFQLKEKFTSEDFIEVAIMPEGQIVGFHFVKKVPYLSHFAGSIYTLWVSPNFRKQGIGTTLKQRAEQWARGLKVDHLYTSVHVDNSQMISLSKELGFEIVNYKLKKKL